jgi:diguanylate cyclase (GGDEF)-like protein
MGQTTTNNLRVRVLGDVRAWRHAGATWPLDTAFGCFDWLMPHDAADDEAVQDDAAVDAVLACGLPDGLAELPAEWVRRAADAQTALCCMRAGAQDVLSPDDLAGPGLAFRVRAAIERKKREREARTAYATDLQTGLPHRQQLVEHMSHLLALREREPAPMAVLVLRVEGLATVAARMGPEAVQVLRRKVAVRLRAGVRASDVVASLGEDSYAVLLASVLTPADAQRVGQKLLGAMHTPLRVNGQDVPLATALGLSNFPEDGSQPDALLQRAIGLAASSQAQGRAGMANFVESGGQGGGAANDD